VQRGPGYEKEVSGHDDEGDKRLWGKGKKVEEDMKRNFYTKGF
jgi:hypothetical protein